MQQVRTPIVAASKQTLVVTNAKGEFPFSKGILSQSLLATSIDPGVAFDVAREIEGELLASDTLRVSRTELRDRAQRVLARRAGTEIAERYLLWRRYQEPERPVVLLLGGTSGVGKSSLAVEVARRLGIGRVLSTDSIRQIMRIMTSPQLVPALYGSSYDAWKLLPHEEGRTPTVIDGFRAQVRAVSVGVRASLDRTVEETANLVIDGVSLAPGQLDLTPYADVAHVVFLLIVTRSETDLRNRFVARARGHEHRLPHRYLENFDQILAIQEHLVEQARIHGVHTIENDSFDGCVRAIVDEIMSSLRGVREPANGD